MTFLWDIPLVTKHITIYNNIYKFDYNNNIFLYTYDTTTLFKQTH